MMNFRLLFIIISLVINISICFALFLFVPMPWSVAILVGGAMASTAYRIIMSKSKVILYHNIRRSG